MPNLKCHEYECIHNHCSHCLKDEISVTSNALCGDFTRGKESEQVEAFEFAYEQAMSLRDDEHNICCQDRKCINNHETQCQASYISVDTISDCPKCSNVREK